MDKRELSEVRKEQILQAAAAVFARLGFHKARMDDIVQEAGLSKGAVYWYFESKDEIITTILNRFMDRELENLQQIGQGEGPALVRLRDMMRILAKEVEEITDLMPIIYEFYAVAAREETIRRAIQKYLKNYSALLEEVVREGIERGELRDVPARDAALSLVVLIEGCMLIWILGAFNHRESNLENLFETAFDILLKGLVAEV